MHKSSAYGIKHLLDPEDSGNFNYFDAKKKTNEIQKSTLSGKGQKIAVGLESSEKPSLIFTPPSWRP